MKIPFLAAGEPKAPPPPETAVDELVVGKVLSLEMFRDHLKELGYSFEVYTDKDYKIIRFNRVNENTWYKDGDVW